MSETSREFDWNAFEGDVIQQQVEKVAVYANPRGDIVIRQERRWDEEEDVFIVIARAHAFAAARAILCSAGIRPDLATMVAARPDIDWQAAMSDFDMAEARDSAGLGEDRASPRDPTGAERQRRYRARKRNADRDAAVTEPVAERDAPILELVG
jgi:hypothetical protein